MMVTIIGSRLITAGMVQPNILFKEVRFPNDCEFHCFKLSQIMQVFASKISFNYVKNFCKQAKKSSIH